jgi:hypothetical protein
MKKLLAILVLGLLWCNVGFADNLPIKLFGITIYDNAEKYVEDLNKGEIDKTRPGDTIIFWDKEDFKFKNLERNTNFDKYYLRTNEKYKIITVGGSKYFDLRSTSTFQNVCSVKRINLTKSLAKYYGVDQSRFVSRYYKYVSPKTKTTYLFESSQIYYTKKYNKLIFSVGCRYGKKNENISQTLIVSLFDQNYWKNSTLKSWEKIKPFDDSLLTSDLQGF